MSSFLQWPLQIYPLLSMDFIYMTKQVAFWTPLINLDVHIYAVEAKYEVNATPIALNVGERQIPKLGKLDLFTSAL